MTKSSKNQLRKPLSKNQRILGFAVRDFERVAAAGLALGYLDVGIIEVGHGEFFFTLRGPLLWRMTSGLPLYLSEPSTGIAADAYLRIEALLAYLLLVGEAYLLEASSAASTMVMTVGSKWFRFSKIQELLQGDSASFRIRTIILMLINLSVGVGLIVRKFPFVLTAVGISRHLELRFYTSAAPLQRTTKLLPSMLTLPQMSAKLYWIGVVIGGMLIAQQARIDTLLVERGGLLGFSIAADVFRLKVLPRMVRQMIDRADKDSEEHPG